MRIIAIDPGIHTGYCYCRVLADGKAEYFPFQMIDEVDDLWRRLKSFEPEHIVIESFESRQRIKVELFPVQLIGVARLYSLVCSHPCGIYLQTPAQGKTFYTNAQLTIHGLYKRGIPHAMDASRHLLQWLTFGPGYKLTSNYKDKDHFAKLLDSWENG